MYKHGSGDPKKNVLLPGFRIIDDVNKFTEGLNKLHYNHKKKTYIHKYLLCNRTSFKFIKETNKQTNKQNLFYRS